MRTSTTLKYCDFCALYLPIPNSLNRSARPMKSLKNVVTDIFKTGVDDAAHFAEVLEDLFRKMAKGGTFGPHKIRHFNGHLFEEATVFELTEEEIGKLAVAGEADWQFIQPSIMGNLFERGLDPDHRAQLGAHYTSEEDIKTLVEPVLMAPLRREWS